MLRRALLAAVIAAASPAAGVLHAQGATVAGSAADIAARTRRADAAYDAGDRARAEREYSAILALDPAQSRAIYRLAGLRQRRDPDAAVALYRRYVKLEPRDAWGFIALGDALAATGDVAAGLAAYDAAARLEPGERDVEVGRARLLARAGHTDAAIDAYAQFLVRAPRDADAWAELAVQHRRAGRPDRAIVALERRRQLQTSAAARADVEADVARLRAAMRASVDPFAGGSRDSDGLATARVGVAVTSPLIGGVRVTGSVAARRAGDELFARHSQDATVSMHYRPSARLRVDIAAGMARADRALIDTASAPEPAPRPGSPRAPIGRAPEGGASTYERFPVGRARLVWRKPGDGLAVDARLSRQLLDASPFLVAQGVQRDEASLALDRRLRGPVRARVFGRLASVHNEAERNRRHIAGGALAWVPGAYEVTVRGQTLGYAQPTSLAYFAPRQVHTAELTTYTERETARGTTFAVDLGAGAQQVADRAAAAGSWSPAFRGWAQVVVPLDGSRSLGAEIEAYDSRIGMDTPTAPTPDSRWRYGSANVWLRIAF